MGKKDLNGTQKRCHGRICWYENTMRVRVDMKKGCSILDNNRWPQGSQVNFTIYLGATGTTIVQGLVPHDTGTKFLEKTTTGKH